MFELILTTLTLLAGLIWAGWALRRRMTDGEREAGEGEEEKLPLLVDYAKSFFPVLLIVLVLRSFIVEPFRIPSASMLPTLHVGDFILVNKFTYGLRLPVLHTEVVDFGEPERGDVIVFRFPEDESVDFIKRVVGVPGDRLQYRDKQLIINGDPVPLEPLGDYEGPGAPRARVLLEELGAVEHRVLHVPGSPAMDVPDAPGMVYVIPPGHYFVMGDNRDNSNDSRYWGLVPEQNLVGRAFFIWMSWDMFDSAPAWSRIGESVR